MKALAFSGGKDSLACWYLCRHENPVVYWVNTGKAYPETIKIVEEIKSQAADFVEVKTDQQSHIEVHGLPSDVVPVDLTSLGNVFIKKTPIKVQSYLDCCYQNISRPLMDALKHRGVTELIKGQRNDDTHKATARNGDIVEGILIRHPIENWSSKEVLSYVELNRGSIPEHFNIDHSSLDCYDCTAYLAYSADRVAWMKQAHPDFYEEYLVKITALKSAVMPYMERLCLM
jgi:3'-phosphoadenosine 5'-phosphosulfate sulfotransferase (PAPS reductase)/FAD synthetase